jgi:hypothetical protein
MVRRAATSRVLTELTDTGARHRPALDVAITVLTISALVLLAMALLA